MAGVDTDFDGTVRPLAGIKVGYLPQEPELDETKNVKENVFDGVQEKKNALDRFLEVRFCQCFGEKFRPNFFKYFVDGNNIWSKFPSLI